MAAAAPFEVGFAVYHHSQGMSGKEILAHAGANVAINTLATGISNGATPFLRGTLGRAGLRSLLGPVGTIGGLALALGSGYGLDQIKQAYWPF